MRNVESYLTHSEAARKHEMWLYENRRSVFASKVEPRWAYSKNGGSELNQLVSDPNYLFMKSLEPIDRAKTRLQVDAFKRTQKNSSQFKQEVASII